MNVLYIADVGETGGATKSLMELMYNLNKNYDVNPIVVTSYIGKMTDYCKKNNFLTIASGHKAFYISKGQTKLKKFIKFFLIPYYFVEYKIKNIFAINKIIRSIEIDKIDIIHSNVNRNDIGALLARKYKIPHVWHIREFGELDYECFSLRNNYISFMNKNTTKFIAISEAIKKYWVEKGILDNKIDVIYNGVKSNNYILECSKISKEKIKMVIVGYISKNKGQIQVIEAINKLDNDIKRKVFLDIYGNGSKSYINKLKNLINKYGLSDNIKFMGTSNNLYELLCNYDIGLMCSKAEGFGRVTVEYMLSKLYVIASNSGANSEIIKNNENGVLYETGDSSDLAKKITDFHNKNLTEIEKIKFKGYNDALKYFTSDINSKNVYNVYKQIKNGEIV